MTQINNSRIQAFLQSKSFTTLTKVQAQVYSTALKGKDIIAISKTGTGKTHAYLLPIFSQIDINTNETQVVIVSPTQELTQQIYQFASEMLPFFEGVRLQKAIKGQDKSRLIKNEMRHPHILIGTLGKLKSLFIDEGIFRLDQARTLVIDEADMMLEKDNLVELDLLAGRMRKQLQIMVFSATIPDNMNAFMRSYMHQPKIIRIESDLEFDPRIEHVIIPVKDELQKKLFQLIPNINPALCLIFVKEGQQLDSLGDAFTQAGIRFVSLHGKMSARQRLQTLKQIQDQQIVYVLSTDVAARGLDFPSASDIISLGFPKDLSFYTHRAGRTGRAGKSGRIFTLYSDADDRTIRKLIEDGIKFKHYNINSNGLRELKPYNYVHSHKKTEMDKEISQMVQGRSKVVKPGYKKKLTAEIEKLKRKRRRKIIQDSIKSQHILKSKLKQMEKKTGE